MRKKRWVFALLTLAVMNAWGQKILLQPDSEGVYQNWSGIKVARLVKASPVTLREDPRLNGLKHVCSLIVVVGLDGIPKSIEVAGKTKTALDDAAIAAVRQSQFEAGTLNGAPVATRILVWVPFAFGTGLPVYPESGSGAKNFKQPVVVHAPEIEISDEARREGVARREGLFGTAVIQMLVNEEGLATHMRLALPAGHGMDEKAMEAVGKCRFRPATLDGVPVPAFFSVEVHFRVG